MKNLLAGVLLSTVLLTPVASYAAEQMVKLSVPGMTCASCPFIVRESILMLDGIMSVEATMDDLSATVVYDDAVTNVEEIRQATTDVGYPSSLFNSGS